MDLPILGTIDLTPTGIFLFCAALLAVGYFGWQLYGAARAGRDAGQTPSIEKDEEAPASKDADDALGATDSHDAPGSDDVDDAKGR
ncbi:hypothetical protein LGT39_05555 [Demequina sp. TTPB684]|uniref:hypothetical protein n=1 Tax=unclassified Demequina TaxID=2620311 RepID=UPI001CF4C360|nr:MULTISPECIES: hypothetical protein [unclassified Demequina]MCB2412312.1 hypothetical protein [Demequina sp. TTPB684]UPU89493.1 hypothetical protein LGT36_006075 [Demequina sp. TMPB413]